MKAPSSWPNPVVPRQDGPPRQGFPHVRYARTIPNVSSGTPHGTAYLLGVASLCAVGFASVFFATKRRHSLELETSDARAGVVPVLQAEEDVHFCAGVALVRAEREGRYAHGFPGLTDLDDGVSRRTGLWVKPYQAENRSNR